MGDNCALCLLGAMDRAWFHQFILFPHQPVSQPISETLTCLSSNISQPKDVSPAASAISPSEDDSNSQHDDGKVEVKAKKRPTRLNIITSKSRSRSSSPWNQIHPKRLRSYSGSVRRLQKTMSCKTLLELELEEVKGFMDLGFEFRKEHLSPRMIKVLPGLQRLVWYTNEQKNGLEDGDHREVEAKDDHEPIEDEEEERGVMRPYLSEAWDVKRPDSPLLNLRLPKVSAADDMKKHLRYWARTVASVIRQ